MKRDQREVMCLLCLESALLCFAAGCADTPKHYWVKSGITSEQIRRDNFHCADMTAQKPPAYSRGSAFYYASLDQPAYQQCMKSRGYRMVSEEELRRGVSAAAPGPYLVGSDATRKLCQQVTGWHGDVESCIRYLSMSPNKVVLPDAQFEYHGSTEPPNAITHDNDDIDVCLRHDASDSNHLKMTVSRNCGATFGQTGQPTGE